LVQDHLRGSLNVHGNSLREKVVLVGGHGSLSFSKKEKVESYVEVASSKETKSADEKAWSNGGIGVIRRIMSGSERAGAPFQAFQAPFQEVGVQEVNDCGPSSLKECSPMIGCVENGVLREKREVGNLKCQSALMKSFKKFLRV